MKYRVDFFKEGGKWYTGEEIILPQELVQKVDNYIAQNEWGDAIYEIRCWVEWTLTKGMCHYKGMHAVVTVPEGDDYLAYPMMVPASERR